MARKRTRLALSAGQLARIKRRLRSTSDSGGRKRLRVVCWAASGHYTLAQLARRARRARSTIQLWLGQFSEGGIERLLVRKFPPGRRSPMAQTEVQAPLLVGLKARRWRSAEQGRVWLKSAYDIHLTTKSVRRRLRKMGVLLRPPHLTPLHAKAHRQLCGRRGCANINHPLRFWLMT